MDPHIIRGKSTYLGRGLSLLIVKDLLDFREITIAEDNSSVSLQ